MNDKLDLISAALAQKMGAKQIILFGSKADATDRPESDLDLCVLADLKNKRKIDFMRDARRELLDLISDPLNLLFMMRKTLFVVPSCEIRWSTKL